MKRSVSHSFSITDPVSSRSAPNCCRSRDRLKFFLARLSATLTRTQGTTQQKAQSHKASCYVNDAGVAGGFDAAGAFSKAMVNAAPVVVPRCYTAIAVALSIAGN